MTLAVVRHRGSPQVLQPAVDGEDFEQEIVDQDALALAATGAGDSKPAWPRPLPPDEGPTRCHSLTAMPTDPAACHCVVCQQADALDPRTQSTVDTVAEHGWQVMMIPADDQGPGWAYTIGLWHRHRIPELAMFGLEIHLMQTLLNDLSRRAVEGQPLETDQERHDIAGVPIMLKPVDYRWYKAFFGTAIGFYRKLPFPFLQVLWPNRDGAFPWQAGGENLRDRQPRLSLHPDEHPVGVWTQDL
ncbi:DUF4262 domain-containing protein [Streptomyces sp. 4N124]|uniref:DUF4262 domain-containing protein n=1 Tax=Streptomyces sp. 4N124 TaxID=3457420 RepID=UPI003FD297A8